MLDVIILILLGVCLIIAADCLLEKYYDLKRIVEEKDDFEKLMRKQLELDAARLKAQEDLLHEACRSWAEDTGGDE